MDILTSHVQHIQKPPNNYFITFSSPLSRFPMLLAHPTGGFFSASTSNRIDEYVQRSIDGVFIHGTGLSTSRVQHRVYSRGRKFSNAPIKLKGCCIIVYFWPFLESVQLEQISLSFAISQPPDNVSCQRL